jgi:CRISPR-associated protein Cas2
MKTYPASWILAYDITDKRRLQRVSKYMSQEGIRLQLSVYLLTGHRKQIELVVAQLLQWIDIQSDDFRIYALTENSKIWLLGKGYDLDGVTLSDSTLDSLVHHYFDEPHHPPKGLGMLSF